MQKHLSEAGHSAADTMVVDHLDLVEEISGVGSEAVTWDVGLLCRY